ncbi:F0F1 ATP synthase subunit epsilon [Actinomyces faecalis]|uniref:F0F1 ATP synthase subunit epsilon n=1 Tax=Actinomyces faecalis TaxID=2722820 RepID=UPI0015522133|nr:F0F1 ATP synthase subunit epsilon [Actinomyces faecalis]
MSGARELSVAIVSRRGGRIWQGPARSASVPLVDGELGVLPGRQPILALLGRGTVRVVTMQETTESVEVAGGFCSVDHDVVTVAADRVGDEITGDESDIDLIHEEIVETDSQDLD